VISGRITAAAKLIVYIGQIGHRYIRPERRLFRARGSRGVLVIAIGERARRAVCGRLFAASYEWLLRGSERAGMADRRRDLLTRARGATVEIGAGTGLNMSFYPDAVTELVLTEPSPYMERRLRARAAQREPSARVVEAAGEDLPFPDASFDTVVATLVLCTVGIPQRHCRRSRGSSDRTANCYSSSMSAPVIRGLPRSRIAGTNCGYCSAMAATATGTPNVPSQPGTSPSNASLAGRCPRRRGSFGR